MNKVLLIVLDGFGEAPAGPGNAVSLARTPTLHALRQKYPWTLLRACGEAVGVPEGTQGGSEVGHFTLGAGRIVWQSLEEINRAIRSGAFFENTALKKAFLHVKKTPKARLHLLGMISDEGIHAHISHLFALLIMAEREKVGEIFIHAITDGRDVPPGSAAKYIAQIEEKICALAPMKISFASLIGRYYAMDRDHNWERTKKAFDLYTKGVGAQASSPKEAVRAQYEAGVESDYYIEPTSLDGSGVIRPADAVIFWNFRSDRTRQLTWAFTGEADPNMNHPGNFQFGAKKPFFVCMGPFSHIAPVAFPTPHVANNLGAVLADHRIRQFRLAETEKYPHVTYFFNSQIEEPYALEERLMVDSPKCPSYSEKPEMSAHELTNALIKGLNDNYGFILVNFANPDLVGHSGNLDATIRAVETVDTCLKVIVQIALEKGFAVCITGDHGNAEQKMYADGSQSPSHTTNPVPFILCSADHKSLKKNGFGLQDVAPTILTLMHIPIPQEMTGRSMIKA